MPDLPMGINGHAAENLSAGSRTVDQVIARWEASPGALCCGLNCFQFRKFRGLRLGNQAGIQEEYSYLGPSSCHG